MISFIKLINQVYPRVLTQVNRDQHSSSFGSFDRNWWHYKIRDFSSIILQQGGYLFHELSKLKEFENQTEFFHKISLASVDFWTKRGLKKGAFEEYYPWENGYPPLAFSTLAAAKLIYENKYTSNETSSALKIAASKLKTRFENRAANQQIAGLAALSVIKKINPALISNEEFEQIVLKTLLLQDAEGWFMEYDGPDLGYLSVSLDCLWDLYDYTKDIRFLDSAEKAFLFISDLIIEFDGNIGMHNSRNTDYIVPYGIARFLSVENEVLQSKALKTIDILYRDLSSADHFFNAIDDRYWSHYIGHSVARAQNVLSKSVSLKQTIELQKKNKLYFKNAGYRLISNDQTSIFISCKKGGIITLKNESGFYSDFGFILFNKNQQFVNHWWNDQLTTENKNDEILIQGQLVGHQDNNSNPYKHSILRLLSFIFGHHIINLLKKQLIFKDKKSNYTFERKISFEQNKMVIFDKIFKLSGTEKIIAAPRFSKRHVASADSYHIEDQSCNRGIKIIGEEKTMQSEFISIKEIHY